jgi:hypothetical protein
MATSDECGRPTSRYAAAIGANSDTSHALQITANLPTRLVDKNAHRL